jgi:hypothetical protein
MAMKPILAEMMGVPESAFPEPATEQKAKEISKN